MLPLHQNLLFATSSTSGQLTEFERPAAANTGWDATLFNFARYYRQYLAAWSMGFKESALTSSREQRNQYSNENNTVGEPLTQPFTHNLNGTKNIFQELEDKIGSSIKSPASSFASFVSPPLDTNWTCSSVVNGLPTIQLHHNIFPISPPDASSIQSLPIYAELHPYLNRFLDNILCNNSNNDTFTQAARDFMKSYLFPVDRKINENTDPITQQQQTNGRIFESKKGTKASDADLDISTASSNNSFSIPNLLGDEIAANVSEHVISRSVGKPTFSVNRFNCPICKRTYSTQTGLTRHYTHKHNMNQNQTSPNPFEMKETLHKNGTKSAFPLHSTKERVGKAANNSKCDAKESAESTRQPRPFCCHICTKIYYSMSALKMHVRTHTLPCKCNLCGKAFSRMWLLNGHLRTHTGEKPFSCVVCARAFADRSNLRAHMQTHSDVKRYRCVRCSKTFSRMGLLGKHQSSSCGLSLSTCTPDSDRNTFEMLEDISESDLSLSSNEFHEFKQPILVRPHCV